MNDADSRLPIKMLHDRVLAKYSPEDGERKSSGGILIPATAQVAKRLSWAEVLAVGNHVRTVKAGDRILFNEEDQFEVEMHGEDYVILRERDLHAIAAERVEPSTGLYL
ncbi:MAG TPA: co-chaperone GroES [Mycobacteriales bacterium]|nr:co-chaperone GroES [Mycobacteriales bacterium]